MLGEMKEKIDGFEKIIEQKRNEIKQNTENFK